jgi:hypothetical protein
LFLLALSIAVPNAQASEPISISSFGEYNRSVVVSSMRNSFVQLSREIAVIIADPNTTTGRVLGFDQFDMSVSTNLAFPRTTPNGAEPSPWVRASESEDPRKILPVTALQIRKGLPLGLELNGRLAGMGAGQGVVGGGLRTNLYDGTFDVSAGIHSSGFIGNDELALWTTEYSLTTSLLFRSRAAGQIPTYRLSPFLGVSHIRVNATPIIDTTLADTLNITPVSAGGTGDGYADELTANRVSLGMELVENQFRTLAVANWSPSNPFGFCVSVGLSL